METKIKHLEMIQAIINRQANNSFLLKGWAVTITVALLAFSTKIPQGNYRWLIIAPLIIFWFLDAYYLSQERLFRDLYNLVRKTRVQNIDFSMDTQALKSEGNEWLTVLFSPTLMLFYGTSLALITFYINYVK